MKDFKFLRFLDKLKPLFERLGVDYPVMRKILQMKLLMDGRRVPTVFNGNKKSEDTADDNKFLKSLWIYVLMGLTLIPFVIMKDNYLYQMSIVFVIVMFFVMTSLISDFSSVLLDVRDKNIIGTKPIGPKTLSFAKTIHITLYMFYITAALTVPALLVSLLSQGAIFFLVFLISIVLLDMVVIVLTSLIYFLVLRFFDGEKLKDIINYIQIFLTIAISVGYQLFGRLFSIVDLKVEFVPAWWQYFAVPVWFSAPFQILKKSDINSTYIIFTIMAIVVPLLAIAIYLRLMPIFEQNLQKLSNNHGRNRNAKGGMVQLLSRILCRSREEGIFFRFAYNMMKNEREFKLKVYPQLGFSIVFPLIFLFQQLAFTDLRGISQGRSYFYIYFCGFMLPAAVLMTRYSERYKGAWIYKTLPIDNFAPVFKGTLKAFIARLFLPIFLLEAIIFIAIFGFRIGPDILLVFLNMMIFIGVCFIAMKKSPPFSEAFESAQQANGIINLILIAGLAALAGVHFLLSKTGYGVYIFLVLAITANWVLWKFSFNISQQKLKEN